MWQTEYIYIAHFHIKLFSHHKDSQCSGVGLRWWVNESECKGCLSLGIKKNPKLSCLLCWTTKIIFLVNVLQRHSWTFFFLLPWQQQIKEAAPLFTAAPFACEHEREDYMRWCNPPLCMIIPGKSRRTWFAINLAHQKSNDYTFVQQPK